MFELECLLMFFLQKLIHQVYKNKIKKILIHLQNYPNRLLHFASLHLRIQRKHFGAELIFQDNNNIEVWRRKIEKQTHRCCARWSRDSRPPGGCSAPRCSPPSSRCKIEIFIIHKGPLALYIYMHTDNLVYLLPLQWSANAFFMLVISCFFQRKNGSQGLPNFILYEIWINLEYLLISPFT